MKLETLVSLKMPPASLETQFWKVLDSAVMDKEFDRSNKDL